MMEKIRKTHENIAVGIGFFIGCTLSAYFFTFSMLVDQGNTGMLWFQGISSLVMVLVLYKLKHVAFFFTRLWLGRRADLREVMASLAVADLAKKQAD